MSDFTMELVGLSPIALSTPAFATPIFSNRRSNRFFIQEFDDDDVISGFLDSPDYLIGNSLPVHEQHVRRTGQQGLFGFIDANDISTVGTRHQVRKVLESLLPHLSMLPFVQFQVAQFCEDTSYILSAEERMNDLLVKERYKVHEYPDIRGASLLRDEGYRFVVDRSRDLNLVTESMPFQAESYLRVLFERPPVPSKFSDGSFHSYACAASPEAAKKDAESHLTEFYVLPNSDQNFSVRYRLIRTQFMGRFANIGFFEIEEKTDDWRYTQSVGNYLMKQGLDGICISSAGESDRRSFCIFNPDCIHSVEDIGGVELQVTKSDNGEVTLNSSIY